ncbi:tetratricopeptide repeat protein [Azotobacter beijerinckii]|uniref:Tetratricopeptide repeat-containing protein n=1 Tax=Azotobacter beijerinckii TaxID=170623 RepID=A0A1I3ZBB9_9GAMM|nr:hypothetical protein [Azotobacter beijerinckii]SFA81084.1 Tetratricopeptide repeat-containing protein [Azotobacter beijerinckii]SFK41302.1 Tetratricopeptide repeat-containing protein [Azotobacter beijerinckii]
MRRLLLVLLLLTASAQAAQNVEPGVFLALQAAQAAQQKGDLAAARRALEGVKGASGSLEEALLWRSRGYLAWAEGDHGRAIELLSLALASGKLDKEAAARERLDLAKLNAVEGRDAAVVELLAPLSAKADEEILPMLAQAYQGLGRHDKALPLAERYVQANPRAADSWLRFLVAANADLRRWAAAERWQRQLLLRHPDEVGQWRQLAALQQTGGAEHKALATLRTAYGKGLRFSESELDNLVLLASRAGQPWQGARLLAALLQDGILPRTPAREERLGQLWWQARDRQRASEVFGRLAARSGNPGHWLSLARLELEQAHWNPALEALTRAEQAGAGRSQVGPWRDWAEGELAFEHERHPATVN